MKFRRGVTIVGALVTVLVCVVGLLSAGSQAGQAGQTERPQMSEEAFKNVQSLKGIPVDEFMDTMGMFSSSLGLCCTDCHDKDAVGNVAAFAIETEKIRTARRMIGMMNLINTNFFRGEKRVTCYSCHNGAYVPESAPDLVQQYSEPPDLSPNSMDIAISTASPQPIFDKYLQALGGAQRVATLTSFVATGTYTGYETGMGPVPLEIYSKAPNQRAMIMKLPEEDSNRIFDGVNGWIKGPERPVPLIPLTGGNLYAAHVDAVASFPALIRQDFDQWRVGNAVIDGAEVSVARGIKTGRPFPVNFYFDAESGLLKRIVRWAETAVGPVPTQLDFDDYRQVAGIGIQLPFKQTTTWTNGQSYVQLNEIRANVPIEATRFAKPAPARPRQ